MRARPAGSAESSVFHNSARRGPTKEAHRRALNQPDGLLRSVAGQGHGRFLPVTLPRGASDQQTSRGRRAQVPHPQGDPSGEPSRGTHQGRDQGTSRGTDPGRSRGTEKSLYSVLAAGKELHSAIARRGGSGGRNRPRRGRDPAPGRVRPMPSPAGKYHPARKRPASSSFVLGRRSPPAGMARCSKGGLRALQLDPGSGRMVPRTRVGRSARRAAAPAGRGRCRAAHQRV